MLLSYTLNNVTEHQLCNATLGKTATDREVEHGCRTSPQQLHQMTKHTMAARITPTAAAYKMSLSSNRDASNVHG